MDLPQRHDGADALPELEVRDADDHSFGDVGKAQQLALDVQRRDLVPAGLDDVERGAADDEVVGSLPGGDVAGFEVAVGIVRVGGRGRVEEVSGLGGRLVSWWVEILEGRGGGGLIIECRDRGRTWRTYKGF